MTRSFLLSTIAAVLGAFTLAPLVTACCGRSPPAPRPSLATRVPSASPPAVRSLAASATPASASAAAPALPVVKMEPGDDLAPVVASTPEASLAARPSWGSTDGYAPSLWQEAAAKLFGRSPSVREKVTNGATRMLACRASYSGFPDGIFFAAPELDVDLAVGKHGTMVVHGPEDTHVAYLTAPMVRVARDTPLSIHLSDRDAGSPDDLGHFRLLSAGTLPLTLHRGLTDLECRGVDDATLAAAIAERVAVADEATSKLASALAASKAPVVEVNDLGVSGWFAEPRDQVGWIAAHTGWDDPRVVRRVRWLEQLEAQFARSAAPLIEQLHASAPSDGEWAGRLDGSFQVSVLGATCGMDARKRYARLTRRISSRVATSACVYRVALRPTDPSRPSPDEWDLRMEFMNDTAVAFRNGLIDAPLFAGLEENPSTSSRAASREARAERTRTALFVGTREVDTTDPGMVPRLFMHQHLGSDDHPVRLRLPD